MGPTNYKPRRNHYQPLRDQEQQPVQNDQAREASGLDQSKREDVRQSRQAGLTPGGPLGGGLVASQTYANADFRARSEHLHKAAQRTPIEQRLEQDRTQSQSSSRIPIEDRVREEAQKQHELPDSAIQRENSQGREL